MNERQHRQIGVYPSHPEALRALHALRAGGVPALRLHLLHKDYASRSRRQQDGNDGIAERLTLGALAGTAVGALMGGALLMLMLLGDSGGSPRTLMALPVLGVVLGALGGALLNASTRLFGVGARIRGALARGRVVVVVHPRSADEGRLARRLMRGRP